KKQDLPRETAPGEPSIISQAEQDDGQSIYTGERVVLSGAKPVMPVYTDPAGFVADKTCRASV
ncbi:MAG: hypothetical protein J5I98_07995, partial [Phaeodactylibacter sp.]|nr:hypothetical protein [Phaeodactylibacter sp.]